MWLQYNSIDGPDLQAYQKLFEEVALMGSSSIMEVIKEELNIAIKNMLHISPKITTNQKAKIVIGNINQLNELLENKKKQEIESMSNEGYLLYFFEEQLYVVGKTDQAVLYGTFHLLRLIQLRRTLNTLNISEQPTNQLRMLNQWDNLDGSIERGYSGNSIFYEAGKIVRDKSRLKDYARFLASIGINAISINNVNVWEEETFFITEKYLPEIKEISDIFHSYGGVQLFLSINFASPIAIDHLETADPLQPEVMQWWSNKVKEIYDYIPTFGGFVVKADSEHRPGPFTYDRDHADGANMLAEALAPYDGKVIWRCFVYNCVQDWRDRNTDRARAAYDHFKPLDGRFHPNVILQIKNGPMDFQVREPVSPLIGAMEKTNQMIEFQVAQEYTGQQKDLCYLIPQWKKVLEFDTHIKGVGTTIEKIVAGNIHPYRYSGIAAVSNIGNDQNWTGHTLAQANLYGYGRLTWNPSLGSEEIAKEWIIQTFGKNANLESVILEMLLESWEIYENYTAPLGGVGWMVTPGIHYGPNIDGYEYSRWGGTYHFADRDGIGVDRTKETGTGYTEQYAEPNKSVYNSPTTCPDDLLLFFHHVPYKYTLKNGKTVIQHIYDTHFKGLEQVKELRKKWNSLESEIDDARFENVRERLALQEDNAREWCDQINTYFYRKSGIQDQHQRTIY